MRGRVRNKLKAAKIRHAEPCGASTYNLARPSSRNAIKGGSCFALAGGARAAFFVCMVVPVVVYSTLTTSAARARRAGPYGASNENLTRPYSRNTERGPGG